MDVTIEVRPAASADVRALSATLGRAFYDDPVAIWMLPVEKARTARLSRFFAAMTRHHHLAGGGVELATIGSDTGVRGRGFGQALMRSRLRRCDAEYAPAYPESSKPENIPYYQRFGFTVTGEIVLPDGPSLWPMWRAPRPRSV